MRDERGAPPSAQALFENRPIRRVYDEATETWWFSVVDVVGILNQQPDHDAARNSWRVLKNRLGKEGSQLVTDCNQLKLPAADGKQRLTDVAKAETLLRLVQFVPSPKAEPPMKLWLAKGARPELATGDRLSPLQFSVGDNLSPTDRDL